MTKKLYLVLIFLKERTEHVAKRVIMDYRDVKRYFWYRRWKKQNKIVLTPSL